jgi:hypothetical protein
VDTLANEESSEEEEEEEKATGGSRGGQGAQRKPHGQPWQRKPPKRQPLRQQAAPHSAPSERRGQPSPQRRLLRDKPELDFYKPIDDRHYRSASAAAAAMPVSSSQARPQYRDSSRPLQRAWEGQASPPTTTAPVTPAAPSSFSVPSRPAHTAAPPSSATAPASLHPSWAAKIKLKQQASKVSLLPSQGSKIRFTD